MGICGKYSGLIYWYLSKRYQKVVLHGQSSYWSQVKAGVLVLLLVYINDLLNGLNSKGKLLADDTLLFSVVRYPRVTIETLSEDLSKVPQWAYQWKMLPNRDSSKQA